MQPTGPHNRLGTMGGFPAGHGYVAWTAASGTEITASLGQQGGEGAEEETRTGAGSPPPRAPMPLSLRLTLRNSHAQEKHDSSRGTSCVCAHVPRPPFRGIWSPQGRRLQGGNLTLQSRNLETQRSDPAHARVHSRSGTTEPLEEGFPELGMLEPWP